MIKRETYVHLIGKQFHELTILDILSEAVNHRAICRCQCTCGRIVDKVLQNVTRGITHSCGKCGYAGRQAAKVTRADLTGLRFGKLVAIKPTTDREFSNVIWECKCDCGNTVFVSSNKLTMKQTQSCGKCGFQQQRASEVRSKYESDSDRYLARKLHGIKVRCLNPSSIEYHNYGGRGIKICDDWLNDTMSFVKWAKTSGYHPGLEIDRIDVNGDYCPSNCRWVTHRYNSNNKRNNHFVEVDGIRMSARQWSNCFELDYDWFVHLPQDKMEAIVRSFLREESEHGIISEGFC